MRNENRAVFDRASERYDYAFELPPASTVTGDEISDQAAQAAPLAALDRLFAYVLSKLRQRRNRNALLELSDDQLKDIGVSRSQAYADHSQYRRSTAHGVEKRCF